MEITLQQFLEQYISSPLVVALIVIAITWLPTFLPVPTETSNSFYVFIYKVLNAIAANVGKAKNAATPSQATKTDSTKTLLVLLTIGALSLGGCAFKSLEPHEQGIAVAEELTNVYFALEEQYQDLPADTQEQVAPLLNKYKRALILLRDGASMWYKTHEQPVDFDMLSDSIGQLIIDIKAIISEV